MTEPDDPKILSCLWLLTPYRRQGYLRKYASLTASLISAQHQSPPYFDIYLLLQSDFPYP